MTEKFYDIVSDSDGWSCISHGESLGIFPSWLLAVGAVRAAVDRDRSRGLNPTVRFKDLKGSMQVLNLGDEATETPQHADETVFRSSDRLVNRERRL
jgi:hypothetical protein